MVSKARLGEGPAAAMPPDQHQRGSAQRPGNQRQPRLRSHTRYRVDRVALGGLFWLALGACSSGGGGSGNGGIVDPIELKVVVEQSNRWHTYSPGTPFSVDVHVEGDPLEGSEVVCYWVDAHRRPISGDIPITSTATSVRSPSTQPGFYGLEFRSTNPRVAFVPQPAGVPSSVVSFAVIPSPPTGTPEIDEASPFGLVQGDYEDPYLLSGSGPRVIGVHLKSMTWHMEARNWKERISNRRSAGYTEMPLINGEPWLSDDAKAIPGAQLDAIGAKFKTVLAEESSLVPHWQAGLEENGEGRPYEQQYYFANLEAKILRLRAEVDQLKANAEFIYSTTGRNLDEFKQLFASRAFGLYYAGLAHDPYWWPDFPPPEGWLVNQVKDLRKLLDAAGRTNHFLWFGEMGLPVRGPNDPGAFFGYPATRDQVPGSSLDYAARYLVKSHALAIANGVKRIYWYNYQNRGNLVDYAEHHFGLRTYAEAPDDPGHPLPAYVAYINMLSHLKGSVLVANPQPAPNVFAFEFAVTGTSERRVLAWVYPEGTVKLPLSSLAGGLTAASVQSVVDLYGSPISVISDKQISLEGQPIYIRF